MYSFFLPAVAPGSSWSVARQNVSVMLSLGICEGCLQEAAQISIPSFTPDVRSPGSLAAQLCLYLRALGGLAAGSAVCRVLTGPGTITQQQVIFCSAGCSCSCLTRASLAENSTNKRKPKCLEPADNGMRTWFCWVNH